MVLACLWLTSEGKSLKRHVTELFPAFPNTWRATSYRLGPTPALSTNHVPVVFQKNIVHRDLKLGNMVLNKR